ncbi:MAG TPA: thioredoxin domain-containing protein, partial [Candidatus Limnocylindrales bacterium]|nr:thioredoxin domain-containing protein [Candidatus Limnocylindrales bacterium]
CGRKNRVPPAHLADRGRCGACRSEIAPRSVPIEVDPAAFDEIVRGATVPVLVDFWAAWCAPCRMAAPEVEKAARQTAGRALVLKVNTEMHPALAARYGVQGIPNFVVLRDGAVVVQQAGLVPADRMVEWLTAAARAAG